MFDKEIAVGCDTNALAVVLQPLLSETVAVYVPAISDDLF
jgi:hypothetical protein